MRFEGKTIIVTGGAEGLGRACALAFAAEGGAVVIADVAVDAGQALAAEIGQRGGKALFVRTDVGDARDAGCLVDATLEWACGVDVLVSVAQSVASADFLDLREADFDAALRSNLKGAFLVGQAAARAMAARGRGTIVNLAPAITAQVTNAVTSGGIAQLTSAMASGLAGQSIRVNALVLGASTMAPDPTVRSSAAADESTEIVRLVLFLATDAAGTMTGQCVDLAAGRLAMDAAISAGG